MSKDVAKWPRHPHRCRSSNCTPSINYYELQPLTIQQGAGIARILAHPSHGNLAVALLARQQDKLDDLAKTLRTQTPDGVFETFATDTSPDKLRKTFADIKDHQSFKDLKLRMAIYSIKNSSKKPFMNETFENFMEPLETYASLHTNA